MRLFGTYERTSPVRFENMDREGWIFLDVDVANDDVLMEELEHVCLDHKLKRPPSSARPENDDDGGAPRAFVDWMTQRVVKGLDATTEFLYTAQLSMDGLTLGPVERLTSCVLEHAKRSLDAFGRVKKSWIADEFIASLTSSSWSLGLLVLMVAYAGRKSLPTQTNGVAGVDLPTTEA